MTKMTSLRSNFKEWIMVNMKYSKEYPYAPENETMLQEIAREINGLQDLYIITVGNGFVMKKDNTKNPRLYFVGVEIEKWNPKRKAMAIERIDVPQRHQLARIVARTDPKLGAELMKAVNYEIPEYEEN